LLQVECLDDPVIHEARRNKYLMQESAHRKAGLAVVKQKLCETIDDVRAFAGDLFALQQRRVVVKPIRGVASETVYLCQNLKEVDKAWKEITLTQVFGSGAQHENALVQEFVDGTEYAVDVMSRDGDHKIAAIWRYDKRPANGASFCYFKTELIDAEIDETFEISTRERCLLMLMASTLHCISVVHARTNSMRRVKTAIKIRASADSRKASFARRDT